MVRHGQASAIAADDYWKLQMRITMRYTGPSLILDLVSCCLGCEVYGRWGQPCIDLMDKLVRERARMLHPRVRRGTALGLQHRWWGILSISLQKAVPHAILRDSGAEFFEAHLEPVPGIADLPVLP